MHDGPSLLGISLCHGHLFRLFSVLLFPKPPEEGLDLETNRQGTIFLASTESPEPEVLFIGRFIISEFRLV